ncbi:MAG: hypothetical protein VR67_17470 [Peptococcaceae bacterium BRH_c8a]|nr:MAG: hypothetical protein VR67_17470 [Peptococcaceae bacterium BRH_c8a]
MLMTVILLVMLLVLAGIGADLARWYVANEQNQTAVDAASLAGALSGERYVTIEVQYAHTEKRCSTRADGTKRCRTVCISDPPVTRTGKEKTLVDEGGWRRGTCRDRFLGFRERWIEFPGDTESIASAVFSYNRPQLLKSSHGGQLDNTQFNAYDNGRYAPSVVAQSEGKLDTFLLHLIGIKNLPVGNCGQSSTFYEVISGGVNQSRNGAPENGCP